MVSLTNRSVTEPKIHVLHFSYSGKQQPGILKQLAAEHDAANRLKINWTVAYFTHQVSNYPFVYSTSLKNTNNTLRRIYCYFMLRWLALIWLYKNRKKYDIVMLRCVPGDAFNFIIKAFLKRYYSVHHTKELEEVKKFSSVEKKFAQLVEKYLNNKVINKSAGIIAVTQEILHYQLQRIGESIDNTHRYTHVYYNGLDFSQMEPAGEKRSGVPKLLFAASKFQPWHGLDLLLQEASKSRKSFEIHVVGECVSCLPIPDKRIIFHGLLTEEDIYTLAGCIDLGIGSLAMDRNNLKEAATLKVREYLALGIPVYATHRDAGLPVEFPYFFYSHKVDFNDMLKNALQSRGIDRSLVRCESAQYLEKVALLSKLYLAFISEALPSST